MNQTTRHLGLGALLLADCCINVLLLGSYKETLSARAARMREKRQPYFGGLADVIDALFFWQPDHCRRALNREALYGGVWVAWRAR